MDELIFNLKNIIYYYPKEAKKKHEFSLNIETMKIQKGKLTTILGRSGSGKTTLLSLLGLLRKPTSGSLSIYLHQDTKIQKINSNEIWNDEYSAETIRAKYIGFALQGGDLLSHLTLEENVGFALRMFGYKKNEIRKTSLTLLSKFFTKNEHDIFNKMPQNLSQGQYQRGAVARALIHLPHIVLADEPTGNLDIVNGKNMLELLKTYITENGTQSVVLVTHDLDHATNFSDEIFVLNNGKIVGHHKKILGLNEFDRELIIKELRQ